MEIHRSPVLRHLVLACCLLGAAAARAAEPTTSSPPDPAVAAAVVRVAPGSDEFCLVVVPDTQRYAAYFPEIARRQFEWIRDSLQALNVKYVVHVGDIVETGNDAEWIVMDQCFAMLDGRVPYTVVPGNHDLDQVPLKKGGLRAHTKYNAVFPPRRFLGRPWFGGHKGVSAENSFGYFSAAGQQFMVLGLDYGPTDDVLEWARELVSNHEDNHKVIVVTHAYMYDDDTRLGAGDKYSPKNSNPSWNDGDGIWEKFVRRSSNVYMVLSGHVKGDGTGLLVEKNEEGTPVVQILANYQFLEHGGKGWLRIMKFKPREGKMDVYTYSPWLNQFREEPDQRFTVDVSAMFRK